MQTEYESYLVICDSDLLYARHLQEYLLVRQKLSCDVRICRGPESLRASGALQEALLIIAAESVCGSWMEEAEPDRLLILSESGAMPQGQSLCISKYQSAELLAERILSMPLAEGLLAGASIRHGRPLEMIGFYTPVSRALQTTLSLTMGQLLSSGRPSLYMNLEPCAGLQSLLGLTGTESLTDLIYYNECAPDRFPAMLGRMAEEVNGLCCLPPPSSFMELHSISKDQWTGLFRAIDRTSDYRNLILDLSGETDGLLEILRLCDRIYTIERDDPVSAARLSAFEDLLKRFHYEDICMKTHRLLLPRFKELPASMRFLTHGALADYARNLIREWDQPS